MILPIHSTNGVQRAQNELPVTIPSPQVALRSVDSIDCLRVFSTISEYFSSALNWLLEFFCHTQTTNTTTETVASPTFNDFISEHETKSLPHYQQHEQTFDRGRPVHGRLHVSRALIFGEIMMNFYKGHSIEIEPEAVRMSISYHDSGRKGNGVDRWENESREILQNRLIEKGYSRENAERISKTILGSCEYNLIKMFEQSSDCIDIMRPCTGRGGIGGFNPAFLLFLNHQNDPLHSLEANLISGVREKVINQAWEFIQHTENKYQEFNNHPNQGYMSKLLDIFHQSKERWPYLHELFMM